MDTKKLLITVVLFFIISIVIYKFVNQDHNLIYEIKLDNNNALIEENYNHKEDKYYITIEINSIKYDLILTGKQSRNQKIVDDIKYYSKDYQCILPLSKNKTLTDMMCYKDGVIYNYASIQNGSKELDDFVKQTEQYSINDWQKTQVSTDYQLNHYQNQINTYLTDYKGLTIIKEGKIKNIELFDQDIYTQKLKMFLDGYYIVANYNEEYEFKTFYVISLKNSKIGKIESIKPISFNSYIQGVVDHKIYLYDINNEEQYIIDIDKKTIQQLDNNKIKFYANDGWTEISVQKANKKVLFETSSKLDFDDYHLFNSTLDNNYFYKENDGYYEIYFSSVKNPKIIKYLCTVSELDNVKTNDKYAYYLTKDSIIIYNSKKGYQVLLTSKELEFNDSIDFYIE